MIDTAIQVKTDRFDGPLALLLLLIQKEEMSLRDLDLTRITSQYLSFLDQMHELDFDVAGDYLFLAATLILLKSKNCLEETDIEELSVLSESMNGPILSRGDLIKRLEELARFQKIGQALWNLPKKNDEIFLRPKVDKKQLASSLLVPMEVEGVINSMMDYLKREKRKYKVVKQDRLSIKDKILELKRFLNKGDHRSLNEILDKDEECRGEEKTITNTVITFISLLELARLKAINIFQNPESREIYVDVLQGLNQFDVDLADGFEEEQVYH